MIRSHGRISFHNNAEGVAAGLKPDNDSPPDL